MTKWPIHPAAAACLLVSVALVWALPVVPGGDLPQHLASARLFADLAAPALPFHDVYAAPARLEPYDTTYLLLAVILRASSAMTAARILFTAFAVGTFFAFQHLVDALHGRRNGPPVTAVFATLVVWSPVVFMGFVQFYLTLPLLLLAVAELARAHAGTSRRAPLVAGATSVLVACLHPAAAGALVLVGALYALLDRGEGARRRRLLSLGVVAPAVLALALWHLGGDVVGGGVRHLHWREAIRDSQGLEFLNSVLGIVWYDPTITASDIGWTLLGPYRVAGLVPPLLITAWVAVLVWRGRRGVPWPDAARRHARVVAALGVLACMLPWAITVPEELSYINLRMIGVAAALALPLVPPAALRAASARLAILGWAGITLANLALNLSLFAREAEAPLALLAKAVPRGVMTPLVFRGASLRFAKTFRLTHHLPTLYTSLEGGISTQYWARYTKHLPFAYLPGKEPPHPPDFDPERFDPHRHLRGIDWVLLEQGDDDVSRSRAAQADRVRHELDERADLVAEDGLWRLYRVRPEAASGAPPPETR